MDANEKKELIESGKYPWWFCPLKYDEDKPCPSDGLDKLVEELRNDQEPRYNAYREYERLFLDASTMSDSDLHLVITNELKQNELANTIETLWAQVFKTKIVPACAASEADYNLWFQSRAYSRWLEGALDEAKAYEESFPAAGLHSLVYGTGFIKAWGCVEEKAGKIKTCAVNPKYIMVDRLAAKQGKPRQMFQKSYMDKYELLAEYESEGYGDADDRCSKILAASTNDDPDLGTQGQTNCDLVTVWEVWRLPSKPGANDGRHCIWIKGCTLVYERFDWDRFPFVKIMGGAPTEGFYGLSAVKRLAGIQQNLDKLNKKLDESQDVMGVPRILVRPDSGLRKADIDDIPGGILEINDINGVKDWNAQTAAPELYSDRNDAPRKMRSLLGVSDFEVQQQLPQGMRDISGDFLERLVDQGQARHAMFHKQYEQAVCDLGDVLILIGEDLQSDGHDVVVKAPGQTKSTIDSLSFKKVRIARESMRLQILPMSQLPQTFSGKIEAIQKLKELMPNLPPETIARMAEVPDANGLSDLMSSPEEGIMMVLDKMVRTKKYFPPLPFDNHQLILAITTRFINMYRVKDNYDSDVEGVLVRYAQAAQAMGKLGQPDPNAPIQPPGTEMPPMLPPVGPEGMPMAVPGMAPAPPPATGAPSALPPVPGGMLPM